MGDDLVIELFENEWKKKKERIQETKKFETGDFLEYTVFTLLNTTRTINHELSSIESDVKEIKEQMVTKDALSKSINKAVGIGVTIMTLVFAGLQLLMQLLV